MTEQTRALERAPLLSAIAAVELTAQPKTTDQNIGRKPDETDAR